LAPILGLLHGLGKTHEYCVEHSALEERAGGPPAPGGSNDAVSPGDGASTEGHATCPFAPAAGGPATTDAVRPLALRAPALPPLALPETVAPPPAPVPLLILAPKASPPSLA
jgi:hypothetical protein